MKVKNFLNVMRPTRTYKVSCNDIGTDPQCFKYYNGVFNKTQDVGRKENNPLPSKEDNWIIRE